MSSMKGNIVLGTGVTTVSNHTFTGIPYNKFYIKAVTPPTIIGGDIGWASNYLYVPTGCKAAYEAADYWKDFLIIEEVDFNTLGY